MRLSGGPAIHASSHFGINMEVRLAPGLHGLQSSRSFRKGGGPVLADYLIPSLLGMAMLLGGMKAMEIALRQWAGSRLSGLLENATKTPLRGFLAGAGSSALLQSSTAVTVLTIGLVNSGLLTFSRSFGVILGTNVGTCLTTELMSLHIQRYGYPLLSVALAVWLWTALAGEMEVLPAMGPGWSAPLRYGSAAMAGFAVLLIGFRLLQSIGPHLRASGWFDRVMEHASAMPVWGVLGGAALAAAIHSSSAVIGMAMGFADADALSPQTGMAIVLGANIGTCFTGLLASVGGSRGGRFVALSQFALNVSGALLFYPAIGWMHAAAALIAPGQAGAQIAHGQTMFNVACSLLALPIAYGPRLRGRFRRRNG
jgi:phosphate:Na+ symporter